MTPVLQASLRLFHKDLQCVPKPPSGSPKLQTLHPKPYLYPTKNPQTLHPKPCLDPTKDPREPNNAEKYE